MSLVSNSDLQIGGLPTRHAVVIRVSHQGRRALILVAELEGSFAQDWEASKNQAFFAEFEATGVAVNAVVPVRATALPKRRDGSLDSASVVSEFSKRRGYLEEELEAWLVNRLCELLYLTPIDFDGGQDWARYGVDSAVALEVLADLEDRLGLRFPQRFAECRSPAALVSEVVCHLIENGAVCWWRSSGITTEMA